ncbi:helix-turn-helix domain-containing protein [Rhizobium sp. BK176]|uniref:helix-turn-helix domain-containing protein n=1 Tax=Rhizobium sp. BK176 TaxID=2587071 RepID=UPI002A4D5520|nr:transcriptional regulator with XRE-family HTH domain [Rhizobium sp. BK176]
MSVSIQNLTALRAERNMTQQHLADAAEISLRTVKRAEAGIRISSTAKAAIFAAMNVFTSPETPRDRIAIGERRITALIDIGPISREDWQSLHRFLRTEQGDDFQ